MFRLYHALVSKKLTRNFPPTLCISEENADRYFKLFFIFCKTKVKCSQTCHAHVLRPRQNPGVSFCRYRLHQIDSLHTWCLGTVPASSVLAEHYCEHILFSSTHARIRAR